LRVNKYETGATCSASHLPWSGNINKEPDEHHAWRTTCNENILTITDKNNPLPSYSLSLPNS
jgi:hypothetical protein